MRENTALLIIDVQRGMVEEIGAEAWSGVLANIGTLIAHARAAAVPVIHIQHDGPPGDTIEVGTPGWDIHPAVAPVAEELVVRKRTSDAFSGTSLTDALHARGITHLVVTGAQSDYCVDTTVRRAAADGYRVTLVADAHITSGNGILTGEQIIAHHNATLANVPLEGAITVRPAATIDFTAP